MDGIHKYVKFGAFVHFAASKTHPECATLFGPLSAARKEGWDLKKKFRKEIKLQNPLYACVERVAGRSHGRVSLRQCINANA
jgi:hypothetical protein